ncbi:MAG: superoxide dismutase [Muribaculaceae bacterium]|nr:superoxide dismutase [Muribaculaceae bacterium]
MTFTKPKLPYSPDALVPTISEETINFHWGKHEQNYIDTLNSLIEDTEYQDMPLEDIISKSDGKVFNNASQAWNHIFYFFQFTPGGQKEPSGALLKQIESQFGSFEAFKEKFVDAGATIFGSGWVWLSSDDKGNLVITAARNAENPLTQGLRPLLVFDVWEHAYYLDYQNRRKDYLQKLWDIVDWSIVEIRYS